MQSNSWGLSASIDIYGCNKTFIRSEEIIRSFVSALCKLLKVKAFGPCRIIHFGEDRRIAGYSMTQLIETSLISAHFANKTNTVYLDIFSCKKFDPDKAADFATEWFKGKKARITITERL